MKFPSIEENPFRTRILGEEVVACNEHFRIVEDAEPVVPGHFLLFGMEEVPSLADSPTDSLCEFLERDFVSVCAGRRYILVERGRGRFCSSFGHIIHAHGHLVPKDACRQIDLGSDVRAADCLRDALKSVGSTSEYLLAGELGESFKVVSPLHNAPKRLARRVIAGHSSWETLRS